MAAADEPVELGQSIDERIQLVGFARLTPPERCYHLVNNFIADFQNGGPWQYLQNQGSMRPHWPMHVESWVPMSWQTA
mgnify:CR=1 FL=1